MAVLPEGALPALLRDLTADYTWDVLFLQEFAMARPEGLQMIESHLVVIGGCERRKSPALVVHNRWIPFLHESLGSMGLPALN